ncbi:MAG: tetraacyldisaccharide 4'-kinase [Bacteroidia bacterium]|nr:tetraacyldisaccharide 4'-kinase [Bacteroidia bacterium]MDW8417003.1 tetraacyldisaccharide 4'-kinase [Bacteroidia bacterium]
MRILRYAWRGLYVLIAFPLAVLYGLGISVRNWLYDKGILPSYHLSRTIVSIGNLTLGGSGKTPFALYLIGWLQSRRISVGYLSRGYGRRTKGFLEVSLYSPQATNSYGDEAFLTKARYPDIPVAVCEDRVKGAQELFRMYPTLQVLILDDAYQHRRIRRDLDILIIDMQRPIWKDWLFPLGRLREPLHAYKRAHLLILNRKTSATPSKKLRWEKPALTFRYVAEQLISAAENHPSLPVETLRHRSVIAFCGIAHPESFYDTLREAGAYIVRRMSFADHYLYREADIFEIRREFRRYQKQLGITDLLLLTTEKDLFRLNGLGMLGLLNELPLYAVQIAMKPSNPSEADTLLHKFFGNLAQT